MSVNRAEYFVDANVAWNGSQTYSVPVFQTISAQANVDSYSTGLTVSVQVSGHVALLAIGSFAIGQINLTFGSTTLLLYEPSKGYLQEDGSYKGGCLGGCADPACPGAPNPFTYTLTASQVAAAIAAGTMSLSIQVCGTFGSTGNLYVTPNCTLTQTIPTQYAFGSATLSFVGPDGSPLSGVNVVLDDDTANVQVGSATTNSSGTVVFTELNVGDSFTATIVYESFGQQEFSFDLNTESYSQQFVLECPSGSTYCSGNCVPTCGPGQALNPSTCTCESTGITADIKTVLEYVAIAGAVLLGGYAVVKMLPERHVETEIE
ncbi:MAG: carboxypeptidase-like regulatory domain-containing protein [Thermoproteota archaeon]